jgi:hypothetical protein
VRALLAAVALAVPFVASADRVVLVPTGKKLLRGQIRLEALDRPGDRGRVWLGTGLLQSFELEGVLSEERPGTWAGTFDFAYNHAPPFTDISPGISVGVMDALNRTEEGRALYLAVTYRYGNVGDLNQDVPTELTVGLWTRPQGLAFFGVSLPFSQQLRFLAEHDSDRLAGGIELRPADGVGAKVVFEREGTAFGLILSLRF